jgi:retron-type reverse transcriptase
VTSVKKIKDSVDFLDQAAELEMLVLERGGSRDWLISFYGRHKSDFGPPDSILVSLVEIGCFLNFRLASSLKLLISAFSESHQPRFDALYRSVTSSGGRTLDLPSPILESVQRELLAVLPSFLRIHNSAHAYTKGRSQYTNAEPHVGKEMVATIDLKKFFPSVSKEKIASVFRRSCPSTFSDRSIEILSSLACRQGALPVGGCCSPIIANAVMYQYDCNLSQVASGSGVSYTRFADDLTFSGADLSVRQVVEIAKAMLREACFEINDSKTRFMSASQRQIVTGLVVNVRLSTPRFQRRKLRAMLHYTKNGRAPFQGTRELSDASLRAKLGHAGKLHRDWLLRLTNKKRSAEHDHASIQTAPVAKSTNPVIKKSVPEQQGTSSDLLCQVKKPKRQYGWGLFVGYCYLAGFIWGIFVLTNLERGGSGVLLMGFHGFLIGCCGVGILNRNRWCWLLSFLLLPNPVSWLVNGIYLSNRWQEMKDEQQSNH